MKIKKITDRAELNVSAQGCHNDCTYWKGSTQRAAANGFFFCSKKVDARWCKWW